MNKLYIAVKVKKVTVKNIADVIRKSERCVRDKLDGKFAFTLPEAVTIRDNFFPNYTIEDLFCKEMAW